MTTMRAAVEALEATKLELMADLEQQQAALDTASTTVAAREEALAQKTADNKWLQVQCHFQFANLSCCHGLSTRWGHGAACSFSG